MSANSLKVKSLNPLFLIGLFAFLQNIIAQNQISFRQLSVNEGLSQNSAIAISQDSTGYLWIATQDGINKYDGKEFKVFPYNFLDITRSDYSNLGQVYTDKEKNLWIIPADKNPYKFNYSSHEFEQIAGIEDASVIFQDSDKNYWIGTYNNGLFHLDGRNGKVKKALSPSNELKTIYNIIENNEHLLLTTNSQIIQFDRVAGTAMKLPAKSIYDRPIEANFSDIVYDKNDVQWIGTFGHGLYFSNNDGTTFQRVSELSFTDPLPLDLNILDLHIDSKDRLWIATYGRGLYMINFKMLRIQHFRADKHNPRAIHYNDILTIYEDYSNTLWFGTDGAGISYYDEYLEKFNSLTTYQTPENINIDVVRAITVDSTNSIWIGTSGKGLTQFEPRSNSWRTFTNSNTIANGISSNRIMSLKVDEENDIWIGTQGQGLAIFDGDKFVNYSGDAKIPLSASTIWSIYKDRKNQHWLGTRENGLIHFDKNEGEVKKYSFDSGREKSLPSNNIRVITEDDKGNFWLGTETEGIVFFDKTNDSFTSYKNVEDENSLSNNNIKSLYYDKDNTLWIGTNGGGLNAFDINSNTFYNFTEEHGLANNVIYAILPDNEGNLWLSSNKGVTKFAKPNTLVDIPNTTNYDNYDGLATEFNTGAHHIDKDGNLYFGGLDGFYWFDPNEIKENRILPKTTITGLEVFNKEKPLAQNMVLNHDENNLSFTFSSLQFSLPEKNQYQYRLANYDNEWIQSGNTNFARYSHLPPGDYEFMVKSSNYDGIWNQEPVSYEFSIAPPWYWNLWAKVIYICLCIGGVFGIYRYLKWRWRIRFELQQKEQETERLKKLNDFKSKLYTDISHEFRTPLTLISGPVDTKLGQGGLSDTDYSNFSMIKRNTNRLIGLVDQLLDLAKLQKGKLKLKIVQGDLSLFLSTLARAFEYQAESKHLDFEIEIGSFKAPWYDEDAIEKIVTNLLSNALKYAPEGGKCHFEASHLDNKLVLTVSNTIIPNSEIEVEKLFTRFYQKDEFSEGAGVGLALVKELVQLCQGEIAVKTESENTIQFQVILPIEKSDLKNFEILDDTNRTDSKFTFGVETNLTESNDSLDTKDELPILLIVEDHKEVREFIGSIWNGQYRIFEAENGEVGMKKALETIPDLVITDVRMPVSDGITLCNNLKSDERTSHIPVVLLTAGVGEENELKGLISGADDFITKPFKTRILKKRVENLISTRKSLRNRYSQEVVLKATDISITKTDEVFLEKVQKVIDEKLTDSEFDSTTFCRLIGMSRMQLHRKLMALTGLSTSAFIRSQRLKQAVHILKTSDATVNEVAYTVGFNTPSYFIKCFKEAYGKTPSEYLQPL